MGRVQKAWNGIYLLEFRNSYTIGKMFLVMFTSMASIYLVESASCIEHISCSALVETVPRNNTLEKQYSCFYSKLLFQALKMKTGLYW